MSRGKVLFPDCEGVFVYSGECSFSNFSFFTFNQRATLTHVRGVACGGLRAVNAQRGFCHTKQIKNVQAMLTPIKEEEEAEGLK